MSIEAWEMVVIGCAGLSFLVRGIGYAIEDWRGKREKTTRAVETGLEASRLRHAARYPDRDPRRNARVG
jgi:hypothetical protein